MEVSKQRPAFRAEETVGAIANHYPGAPAVMKDMGINHGCGVQLTLGEAAAAAGVSLDSLLHAPNETRKTPA